MTIIKKSKTKEEMKSEVNQNIEPQEKAPLETMQKEDIDKIKLELLKVKTENQELKYQILLEEEKQLLKDKGIFNHQYLQHLTRIEQAIKEGFSSLSKEVHDQTRLQAQIENIEVKDGQEEESSDEKEENEELV